MTQKATEQALTGERGIAMIAEAVGRMSHIWHPGSGAIDFGVDGHIELRDPGSGVVQNVRIGVQSRATTRKWPGETEAGFHYTPSQSHIDYWLSSNQPVLLICSRPTTGEIYWRSIQEWARDPALRAKRRVTFVKARDRFDEQTRDALFDLRASAEDRVEPPTPAWTPETVLLNLMPVIWDTDTLYSATVPSGGPRSVFAPAHERRVHDFSVVLRDGLIWSLSPMRSEFLRAIGASEPKAGPLAPWLDSGQAQDQNLIRDLTRRRLLSAHHRRIAWHREKHLAYFRLAGLAQEWKPVVYNLAGRPGRTVVSPQEAKTREGHTGYRHDAASITVRRLQGQWYVQVRPTYLFTWDGKQISGHSDSALATIKRIETHPAVSQALRMWAHLLVERLTLESDAGQQPFSLGPLLSASSPRSIIDRSWKKVSASELGFAGADELTLFDREDLAA
jgi:Domain of unknown function (DUF4365)